MAILKIGWEHAKEAVLVSALAGCIFIWIAESFSLQFLLPLRLIVGAYLAVFPAGFLLLSLIFPSRDEMSGLEWLAYSIGLNIVVISLGIFFFDLFLKADNSIWNFLRVIFGSSIIFYLLAKLKQLVLR